MSNDIPNDGITSRSSSPIDASNRPTRVIWHTHAAFTLDANKNKFTSDDVKLLTEDPYYRFPWPAPEVGAALIYNGKDGSQVAHQWQVPENKERNISFCQLHNIETLRRNNETHYQAQGPDSKVFYSNHSIDVTVRHRGDKKTEHMTLAFFEKAREYKTGAPKEPIWGSKPVKRYKTREAAQIGNSTKSGYDMVITKDAIKYREAHPERKPSQNEVMGCSARDAVEDFARENDELLTKKFLTVLEESYTADLHKFPEKCKRPEWLHALARHFWPETENPQVAENLGAAPAWLNTAMIVLERLATWFTLKDGESSETRANTTFKLLAGSDLINRLVFIVKLSLKDKTVEFKQELDAFPKVPVFWQCTDAASAAVVGRSLLQNIKPDTVSNINAAKGLKELRESSQEQETAKVEQKLAV